ncbi:MAG: DUF6368 family protein [Acidimicrobiales bacterium]|nr:DUF6368 family protein [Acidimicrobiales bacterium]
MHGASLTVLCPSWPTAAQRSWFTAEAARRGVGIPLTASGQALEAELGSFTLAQVLDLTDDGLVELLGWKPMARIDLVAFVADRGLHRVMARFAAELAVELGGVVDLQGRIRGEVAQRPGLARLRSGLPSERWFVDGDWLRDWCADPRFRLV